MFYFNSYDYLHHNVVFIHLILTTLGCLFSAAKGSVEECLEKCFLLKKHHFQHFEGPKKLIVWNSFSSIRRDAAV